MYGADPDRGYVEDFEHEGDGKSRGGQEERRGARSLLLKLGGSLTEEGEEKGHECQVARARNRKGGWRRSRRSADLVDDVARGEEKKGSEGRYRWKGSGNGRRRDAVRGVDDNKRVVAGRRAGRTVMRAITTGKVECPHFRVRVDVAIR